MSCYFLLTTSANCDLGNNEQSSFWDEFPNTDAPSRNISPTPATPTPHGQDQLHDSNTIPDTVPVNEHNQYVEIKIPSYILAFANVQINISPTRLSAATSSRSRPHLNRQQNIHPINLPAHSPTPRTAPVNLNSAAQPTQAGHHTHLRSPPSIPPSQRSQSHMPANAASGSSQHTTVTQDVPPVPQRIYPLKSDEQAPPARTFSPYRSHGYYIVFVGPRPGIYHEYW